MSLRFVRNPRSITSPSPPSCPRVMPIPHLSLTIVALFAFSLPSWMPRRAGNRAIMGKSLHNLPAYHSLVWPFLHALLYPLGCVRRCLPQLCPLLVKKRMNAPFDCLGIVPTCMVGEILSPTGRGGRGFWLRGRLSRRVSELDNKIKN